MFLGLSKNKELEELLLGFSEKDKIRKDDNRPSMQQTIQSCKLKINSYLITKVRAKKKKRS